MARTTIVAQPAFGSYPSLPIPPAGADLVFTATDNPTDRVTLLVDGKTVLIAFNTDVVARTITIASVADAQNRQGDITAYSVAAGRVAAFGPFHSTGWAMPGSLLNIDVSDAKLRLSVITLP